MANQFVETKGAQNRQFGISIKRNENFPEWYQLAIKAADLAENSPVRGCMVVKPWGYAIWEHIKDHLDKLIKETGHQNAYFPLFIPLSFLEKESAHVEGFAKECAIVTHHRLESKDGKLIPAGELEEPLIVRPTSETIIGYSFAQWIKSYRDLPLLINQWANVVRWEMRPRLFLRTAEILWQEGHTAHATAKEAREETLKMLEVYRHVVEDILAIPLILGTKSPTEKFPGAQETYTIEAIMQDAKALQMGTAHDLGQNFSKAFDVQFSTKDGGLDHVYTTSWGVTTRLIGGLIMVHGDDDGIRLPPKISPQQVVIVPVLNNADTEHQILEYSEKLKMRLKALQYNNQSIRVEIDRRDIRSGEKNWQWIKKGVPVRIEIGMRDIEKNGCVFYRRDRDVKEKMFCSIDELEANLSIILSEIQTTYFEQAREKRDAMIVNLSSWGDIEKLFMNEEKSSFCAKIHWCGDNKCEERLHSLKLSIRCLPLKENRPEDLSSISCNTCAICQKKAQSRVLIGRSY